MHSLFVEFNLVGEIAHPAPVFLAPSLAFRFSLPNLLLVLGYLSTSLLNAEDESVSMIPLYLFNRSTIENNAVPLDSSDTRSMHSGERGWSVPDLLKHLCPVS